MSIMKESEKYLNPMFGITQDEVDAILSVLQRKKYPIYGEEIEGFEKEFAEYVGTKYAVAVSSGTAGLHLSYIACGLGMGDEVITPSHSFYSVTDMMVFEGIKPVFCDINYDSFTVDVEDIKKKISSKTRAIVPVHLNGHPANMKEITEIANERNIYIIENAAHALGAKVDNRKVGTIGDLAVFSFAPGKHITTMGDGGMVTTDNKILADKIRMLHNHGRGPIMKSTDKKGFPLHLGNDLIGYNYRMNEINAAIGRVQLRKFISGISGPQIRRNHAKEYTDGLENLSIIPPIEKEWAYHSFCRFVVKATKRDKLWLFLRKNGVRAGLPYSPPIHLNRTYMSRFNFVKGMLPITEKVTNEILSLPLRRIESYPDQETTLKTINTIKKFYKKNY